GSPGPALVPAALAVALGVAAFALGCLPNLRVVSLSLAGGGILAALIGFWWALASHRAGAGLALGGLAASLPAPGLTFVLAPALQPAEPGERGPGEPRPIPAPPPAPTRARASLTDVPGLLARPALVKALQDKRDKVRLDAAGTLGEVGGCLT